MRLPGKSARSRKGRTTRRPLDLERMERRELLAVYMVTNNGDAGSGTLRQAILNANANGGVATIQFKLPSDELTIAPMTPLPTVTNTGTVIDGTTQTNYDKTTGKPLVVIVGTSIPTTNEGAGITVSGGGCTIKGLVIESFPGIYPGIYLEGSPGDLVQDCYLGTSANGLTAVGNSGDGVDVFASNCTIGGTGATQRNVLSGNAFEGMYVGANKTTIEGNYIGVGADGTTVVPNGFDGIDLNGSVGCQIGGTAAGAGNVISGNPFDGISIVAAGLSSDVIQGNFIGTDVTGTVAEGNGEDGIDDVGGGNNTIGGTGAAGNVISGNGTGIGGAGLVLFGSTAKNNVVAGNMIGVGLDGTTPIGNKQAGILIDGSINDVIGGPSVAQGNVIANNGAGNKSAGVFIQSGQGVEILSNSIHDNTNGGITISPGANAPDGTTTQPAPVLTLAQSAAGQTEVAGTLSANPADRGATTTSPSSSSPMRGPTPAGLTRVRPSSDRRIVTTDGNGNASFDVRLPVGTAIGYNMTATATQQVIQNTSVFSEPLPVVDRADDRPPGDRRPRRRRPTSSARMRPTSSPSRTWGPTTTPTSSTLARSTPTARSSVPRRARARRRRSPATSSRRTSARSRPGSRRRSQSSSPRSPVGTISLTLERLRRRDRHRPGQQHRRRDDSPRQPVGRRGGLGHRVSPNPVAAGQTVSFVVTVLNNGPSVASSVTVVDTLPDGLTNISVDPGQGAIIGESGDV